jgi:hypothetical protein
MPSKEKPFVFVQEVQLPDILFPWEERNHVTRH